MKVYMKKEDKVPRSLTLADVNDQLHAPASVNCEKNTCYTYRRLDGLQANPCVI
jgi:hypothetical protein